MDVELFARLAKIGLADLPVSSLPSKPSAYSL